MTLSTLLLAPQCSSQAVEGSSTKAKVAYLAQNRFELQNDFVSNLLGHLEQSDPDFSFELVSYAEEDQIAQCLDDGSCTATLDYSSSSSRGGDSQQSFSSSRRQLMGSESVALPILDDPVLVATLPQYGQAFMQTCIVSAYWLVGVFAYFILFALFFTGFEKFAKPLRADVRTTALSVKNQESLDLFEKPEEDIVYAGIRKSNQLLTCSFGKNNPLQAIIINIIIYLSLLVLLTAIAVQASLQVSRDISVSTVNDVALKSQVDENIICSDNRFLPIFANNILARPIAFRYKSDPTDFLYYTFIVSQESITDCSSLIVYQSTLARVPKQFSNARKRLQNIRILQDIPTKHFSLLLSQAANPDTTAKIRDYVAEIEANSGEEKNGGRTMREILLQDTLRLGKDADHIDLQLQSLEVQLITNGAAYEHGATIALGILVAFMISVITQVYKDKDRFLKKDFDDRIELVKVQLKLRQKQQAKKQAIAEAAEQAAEKQPQMAINNNLRQRINQQQVFDVESLQSIQVDSQAQVTDSVISQSTKQFTRANLPKNRKIISSFQFAEQ